MSAVEPSHQVKNLGHLLLQTTDLARAEAFYIDFLGFTVRKREPFRDGRPLVVTHEGLGLTDGRPEGTGPVEHIAFAATGVEAITAEAKRRGIEIVLGPEVTPYGLSVYLSDPDGNKIELFGEP